MVRRGSRKEGSRHLNSGGSSPRQPRLLFLVNDPAFFLSHRLVIAKAAQRAGFEVFVATPLEIGVEQIRKEGFRYISVSMKRWGANPFSELTSLLHIWRIYRKIRPDIVHHVTIKPVLYGSLIARFIGVPATVNAISGLGHVFVAQGLWPTIRRNIVKAIYRFVLAGDSSKVIFQNPDDRDFFIRNRLINSLGIVMIKGSGVNTTLFVPRARQQTIPVVLMVARLLKDKGLYEFVEAARFLKRKGVAARFVVAGAPAPDNPAGVSETQIAVWQEEGVVDFLGHCDNMPEVYRRADIICLPSYREGLPKALIEAASSGKPLVATNVPGCREIVRQGINGFLVSLGDTVGLAKAIEVLIADGETRARMGALSRQIILEEGFAEECVAEQTLEIYRELLEPFGFTISLPVDLNEVSALVH